MYLTDKKRYFWVGITALLQGFLLWLRFGEETVIPFFNSFQNFGTNETFSSIPLSITVIVPISLWLSQDHWGRRLMRFVGGLFAVLVVFRIYWLWSISPAISSVISNPISNTGFVGVCVAVFFLLPYFQCRMASWSWHIPYSEMFFQFCRNVFLLFQAAVATGLFWLLLRISAGLFEITGLTVLAKYIFDPLVFCVTTSFVVAVAITLGLKRPGIDSVGRWILSILAWLLPPFAVVSVIFIAYLPFSGLKPLLDTGQASTLMLFLQISLILLANAAWLDGSRIPFAIPINIAAKTGLLTLPFYAALCIYSLGIRIQQYGLSVDRLEAAAILVIMGIWGLGYAIMVLSKNWPKSIGRVNLFVIVIFFITVTLMNTPLLDPRRLTAANQLSRLIDGDIKASDFDFRYMRFNLGRYGYKGLESLKELNIPGSAKVRAKAEEALAMKTDDRLLNLAQLLSKDEVRSIVASADILPHGVIVPPNLVDEIVKNWGANELSFIRGRGAIKCSFIKSDFGWLFVTPAGVAGYEVSGDILKYLGMMDK